MTITITTALEKLSKTELERVSHAAMLGKAEGIRRILGQHGYDGGDADDPQKVKKLLKKYH